MKHHLSEPATIHQECYRLIADHAAFSRLVHQDCYCLIAADTAFQHPHLLSMLPFLPASTKTAIVSSLPMLPSCLQELPDMERDFAEEFAAKLAAAANQSDAPVYEDEEDGENWQERILELNRVTKVGAKYTMQAQTGFLYCACVAVQATTHGCMATGAGM